MLGISMRRMRWLHPSGQVEIRDGLDVDWWRFIKTALPDMAFVSLPNIGSSLENALSTGIFTGFILTGGDDWGVFPERDETEKTIFSFARKNGLPVLGVCRGAQIINSLLGGSLLPVNYHVGVSHMIFTPGCEPREVNSWHRQGIGELAECLTMVACDGHAHVEEFVSADEKIHGVMWHPEREKVINSKDMALMKKMFSEGHK